MFQWSEYSLHASSPLAGKGPDIWCLNLPPGRSCVPLTRGLRIPWRILCGYLRVSRDSAGKEPRCWSGPEGTCAPAQAGLSASLVSAVTSPTQLDWSRRCVPLTRGLKIPWRVLWGPCMCPETLCPRCLGAGADWKGLVTLVRPGFL